jgi:hypothetical protein
MTCKKCSHPKHGGRCSQIGCSCVSRGGARTGSGPKKKISVISAMPLLKKDMAAKLQAEDTTLLRWKSLRNVGGPEPNIAASRLRFDVERYIWDRAEGRPVQQVRIANPIDKDGNTVPFEVDVKSALDKLAAKLLG